MENATETVRVSITLDQLRELIDERIAAWVTENTEECLPEPEVVQ